MDANEFAARLGDSNKLLTCGKCIRIRDQSSKIVDQGEPVKAESSSNCDAVLTIGSSTPNIDGREKKNWMANKDW